jgi:hypothetical protein
MAEQGYIDMLELANENTRFYVFKLPKTQRFACNKRHIKAVFSSNELGWVSIGLSKTLSLNTRIQQPKFTGPVVADITISRAAVSISLSVDRPYLCLYPVRIDLYPEEAAEEFKLAILPKMKKWLTSELVKSETRVFGHAECMVVEWTGSHHKLHQLRWH